MLFIQLSAHHHRRSIHLVKLAQDRDSSLLNDGGQLNFLFLTVLEHYRRFCFSLICKAFNLINIHVYWGIRPIFCTVKIWIQLHTFFIMCTPLSCGKLASRKSCILAECRRIVRFPPSPEELRRSDLTKGPPGSQSPPWRWSPNVFHSQMTTT